MRMKQTVGWIFSLGACALLAGCGEEAADASDPRAAMSGPQGPKTFASLKTLLQTGHIVGCTSSSCLEPAYEKGHPSYWVRGAFVIPPEMKERYSDEMNDPETVPEVLDKWAVAMEAYSLEAGRGAAYKYMKDFVDGLNETLDEDAAYRSVQSNISRFLNRFKAGQMGTGMSYAASQLEEDLGLSLIMQWGRDNRDVIHSCSKGSHCETRGINGGAIPVCIRDETCGGPTGGLCSEPNLYTCKKKSLSDATGTCVLKTSPKECVQKNERRSHFIAQRIKSHLTRSLIDPELSKAVSDALGPGTTYLRFYTNDQSSEMDAHEYFLIHAPGLSGGDKQVIEIDIHYSDNPLIH